MHIKKELKEYGRKLFISNVGTVIRGLRCYLFAMKVVNYIWVIERDYFKRCVKG